MPAKKIKCSFCEKLFWATRSDSMYCSNRCRQAARLEDAKFKYPVIPYSGYKGITFNRVLGRWEIRLTKQYKRKFVGTAPTIQDALRIQIEILGVSSPNVVRH